MQLAYQQFGDRGQPLIILHGLLGSSDNWRTLARRFGQHFRVYAVDLRNHGNSPQSHLMNFQVMAEDLLEFIRDHDLSPAHLLGHSLGGKVAMQTALTFPAELSKLILVDIAPKEYPPSHESILTALAKIDLDEIQSRQEADSTLAETIDERPIRQFLLKNLIRTDEGRYAWQMNLKGLRENYHLLTKNIEHQPYTRFTRPALFIRGERSSYINPTEDETRILDLFPKAEIITIPNAGHWVHADAPDAVFDAVVEFL
jgi:pimeloyl-ACP methyl ester carboxylesterase